MRLSCERNILKHLSPSQLREAIFERRKLIRKHRDERGDDRCWLDDYSVWGMLEDSSPRPTAPLPFEEVMGKCRDFYCCRRAEAPGAVPDFAIRDPLHWDDDLIRASEEELLGELLHIQEAIRRHRDIEGAPRTILDDRMLYAILPEKIPADFRLPPEDEFLGEARAPKAGCPSFWRSHAACPAPHDLSHWGPCR